MTYDELEMRWQELARQRIALWKKLEEVNAEMDKTLGQIRSGLYEDYLPKLRFDRTN